MSGLLQDISRTHALPPVTSKLIRIFATRNIKAGEELYLDYGEDFWREVEHASTLVSSPPLSPALSTPKQSNSTQQTYPQPPITLSPILRSPTRHQRTPPLSGILILQQPPPWSPTTSPPRILGHHNPVSHPQRHNTTTTPDTHHI